MLGGNLEGILQKPQRDEQKRKPHESLAHALIILQPLDNGEDVAKPEYGNGKSLNLEIETEEGNNPCGNSGSDVRTKNDTHGLLQRQKPSVHERDEHDSCCTRGLYYHRKNTSRKESHEPVARHECQSRLEFLSCIPLNAFAHQLHSKKEETQAACKTYYFQNHIDNHLFCWEPLKTSIFKDTLLFYSKNRLFKRVFLVCNENGAH